MVICSLMSRLSIVAALEILPRNAFSVPYSMFFFLQDVKTGAKDSCYPIIHHKLTYFKLRLFLA